MSPLEQLFATTTFGLEEALADEARRLGFEAKAEKGGARLAGPPGCHRRANLWLRTANRVWLRAAEHTGERAERSVDTSGELLFRRGYRQEISRAPMRETLAAGMLQLAGFQGDEPLWDIMCGSGTLAIEAALVARNLAPGLRRRFAFERFTSHDAQAWAKERAEAEARVRSAPAPIRASDLNAGALGTARRNARRAGVLESISIERLDATRLSAPAGPKGLVVANFPYGKRVGDRAALSALYRDVGATMRGALVGWRFAFLVAKGSDVDALGLPFERVFALQNGGIACTLLVGR